MEQKKGHLEQKKETKNNEGHKKRRARGAGQVRVLILALMLMAKQPDGAEQAEAAHAESYPTTLERYAVITSHQSLTVAKFGSRKEGGGNVPARS